MPKNNIGESLNVNSQESGPVGEPTEQLTGSVENLSPDAIASMKAQAAQDLRDALQILEKNHSGIKEGLATALCAGTGAAGSIAALSSLGTVSGLSAAGVTTGLAAAGGLLGGGMLVGIGVLAAPVAVLGTLGYSLASKMKKTNNAAALGLAAKRICEVQSRLIQHEEHFGEELTHIKTTLEVLTRLKTA